MLTLRDREIAKVGLSGYFHHKISVNVSFCILTLPSNVPVQKDILMDKMKNCHMENHSMIEVRICQVSKDKPAFEYGSL